ncbi:ABC transporter substrate-binding protein [Fibrella sp. WM1]|uniref:ABC transporter substrate-binding protein n=1 Tax=Fibrella musci TaxID=3242485 RepID=UPI003522D89B
MDNLRVALDWTPNTNHTGFYVASELGYYADNGLDVALLTPEQDDYLITPAKKLELGQADVALAPFESVISLNTKANPLRVSAIAALLREDISAIVALSANTIKRPRELDGRIYASYKARYEDAIVKQMIINDGGQGDLTITYPDKLGIWNTLLNGSADATWIFDNWEGVEAENQGVGLTKFRLADYGIPYGYSPVLFTTREQIGTNADTYRRFLSATKRGFLYAAANVPESAALLARHVPERDRTAIDLAKSQAYTAAYYGDETNWGQMEAGRVSQFVDWLKKHGLETQQLDVNSLFTNELL